MYLLARHELNDLRIQADGPGDEVTIPRETLGRLLDALYALEDQLEDVAGRDDD